jgi:2-polyprenyl-3-methyl-5-hydroxy-6-metoxy-1,4-benzoquinol methylase
MGSRMLSKFLRSMLRRVDRNGGIIAFGAFPQSASLTRTQEDFVEWNAQQLSISPEESRRRYLRSRSLFNGGHRGRDYRTLCAMSHDVFQVFCDDNPNEVYDAYKFHGPLHFLRFLSYAETDILDDEKVAGLAARKTARIVDYGCGVAQSSIRLAERLRRSGVQVELVLADVPTVMKDFVVWRARKLGLPTRFIDCDASDPYPDLPACDVCIATEVFEHIYDPLRAFERVDTALAPGGWLIANIKDHEPEFFHVSPELEALRDKAQARGYREISPNRYCKGAAP